MVHVQAVKSVWSTLHKVLLQTVGNKRKATEGSVLCLEVEEEENGAPKRTQEAFAVNLPERFPAHTTHSPPLLTVLCSSVILILSQSCRFQNFKGDLKQY